MTFVAQHLARLFGAVGLLGALAAAVHAETAPQFAQETKSATVSVKIDPALKNHPGLFEDCLAEGRREAQKWLKDAAQEMRKNPQFFSADRRWTFERSYDLRSVVLDRYVSVLRDDGTYGGGAHPNTNLDTILWDREARKRMNIRPFFREAANRGPTMMTLARLARLAVAVEKIKMDAINVDVPKDKLTPERLAELDHFIAEGIQPELLRLGSISLAPSTQAGRSSGLTFHYSPYAVGAYAEGPYTVFVPYTAFRQHLSPLGETIFGGERPANDLAQ